MNKIFPMASSRRRVSKRGNDSAAIVVKSIGGGNYHVVSSIPEAAVHGCCAGETISRDTLMTTMGKGFSTFFTT